MEVQRNRPIITDDDHPQTVIDALRYSVRHDVASTLGAHAGPYWWQHRAQNSYETLEDEFGRFGEENFLPGPHRTMLPDLNPGMLEAALVYYGLDEARTDEEVGRVDELLMSIDGLKKLT
jgi:hypothetical protein